MHLFIFDLNFLLQLKLFNFAQVGKWSDMSNKHGLAIISFSVILEYYDLNKWACYVSKTL